MQSHTFVRAIGLIMLGLITLIGALAAFQMLSATPLWSEKGASWVGAIGTVGTLIGTIRIANSERNERKRREAALVKVTAASFEILTADAITALGNAVAYLRAFEENIYLRDLQLANDCIMQAQKWTPEQARDLISGNPILAAELARAASILTRIHGAIAHTATTYTYGAPYVLERAAQHKVACQSILNDLETCVEACRALVVDV